VSKEIDFLTDFMNKIKEILDDYTAKQFFKEIRMEECSLTSSGFFVCFNVEIYMHQAEGRRLKWSSTVMIALNVGGKAALK